MTGFCEHCLVSAIACQRTDRGAIELLIHFISMSDLTYFEHHRHSLASFNLEPVEESSVHRVIMDITIDLLIDQQSVGKRSLHLMDTVNAKKRWTTIYVLTIFDREPHSDPPLMSQHHFWNLTTLMIFHFLERLLSLLFYSVSVKANSMDISNSKSVDGITRNMILLNLPRTVNISSHYTLAVQYWTKCT
jgi:hypothetical protein